MVFAGHQPNYMPNLAFFSKIKDADIFIVLTSIQFERHEKWQNRNKITTKDGDKWLTVPVLSKQGMITKDVKISNTSDWRKKQYGLLYHTYRKKEGFSYLSEFEDIFNTQWEMLIDLNIAIIKRFCDILDITTPVKIDQNHYPPKEKRFISMGQKYQADTYLSGQGANLYLSQEQIKNVEQNGIKFLIHSHNLSSYPYSAMHYLLTFGKKWIQDVI